MNVKHKTSNEEHRPLKSIQDDCSSKSYVSSLAINGGEQIRFQPWPTYDKGDTMLKPEYVKALTRVFEAGFLFRYDIRDHEKTEAGSLEKELCHFFEVKHALTVTSGTTGLALALMALGLPKGSQVAVPAFTFPATSSAVLLAGCVPVIIDVDENLHMDVDDLQRKCTQQMRAVIVVHMRGFASDIETIGNLAQKLGLIVIEDAVPVCGVTLRGKWLGTYGAAGAFSTQSDKTINTGEGGFLLLKDEEVLFRAAALSGGYEGRASRHAKNDKGFDDTNFPLYSFRMDEIRAALAREQLAHLSEKVAAHQRVYDKVVCGLEKVPNIRIRKPVVEGDGYLGNNLIFWPHGADKDEAQWFAQALRAEGIEARLFGDPSDCNVRCFWNWRYLHENQTEVEVKALAPRAAELLETALDVPLAASLTNQDCKDLIQAIDKIAMARIEKAKGIK